MSFALLSNIPATGSMHYILLPGLLSQTAILSQTLRKSQEGGASSLLEWGCSCQAIFSDPKIITTTFSKTQIISCPFALKN